MYSKYLVQYPLAVDYLFITIGFFHAIQKFVSCFITRLMFIFFIHQDILSMDLYPNDTFANFDCGIWLDGQEK